VDVATIRADRRRLTLETDSTERDRQMRRRLAKLPAGILRYRDTRGEPIEKALGRRDRDERA
jgi:hypothetical protein